MPLYDESVLRPARKLTLMESRTLLELGVLLTSIPALNAAPRGDGHPVLVIPGFMVGDTTTLPLRYFLEKSGYTVYPWELGINSGFYMPVLDRVIAKLEAIKTEHGRKVSVIGWSLGGIYAREAARSLPATVRQVISLGTPFARNLKASVARGLYEWVTGTKADEVDPELFRQVQEPPPVPATAIYSRADGIVAWQATMEQREGPITENVEVAGSHCGLGHNPQVLFTIADRLAQPEGAWQPFAPPDSWHTLYPELLKLKHRAEPTDTANGTTSWANRIAELDRALLALQDDATKKE